MGPRRTTEQELKPMYSFRDIYCPNCHVRFGLDLDEKSDYVTCPICKNVIELVSVTKPPSGHGDDANSIESQLPSH